MVPALALVNVVDTFVSDSASYIMPAGSVVHCLYVMHLGREIRGTGRQRWHVAQTDIIGSHNDRLRTNYCLIAFQAASKGTVRSAKPHNTNAIGKAIAAEVGAFIITVVVNGWRKILRPTVTAPEGKVMKGRPSAVADSNGCQEEEESHAASNKIHFKISAEERSDG